MGQITPLDIHVRLYFKDSETGKQHDVVYRHMTLEDAATLVKAHNRNGGTSWDMFSGGDINDRVAPARAVRKEFQFVKAEWSVKAA